MLARYLAVCLLSPALATYSGNANTSQPACRTSDVTDDCWLSMASSCKEAGGELCVLCLASPATTKKTAAAGCPQTPVGKVAECFCSNHPIGPSPGPSPPAPPSPGPHPVPPAPPSPPSPAGTPWWIEKGGPYKQIGVDTINLANPRGTAAIVYPKEAVSGSSDATFPFISFCHGGLVGGPTTYPSYAADMQTIASFGFIVVASTVNEEGTPPLWSEQQRAVIKTCKANPSLHPSLAKADFSRVGVTGHSMGGIATRQTLASNEVSTLNIKAGWLQHPCDSNEAAKINVPAMWTTGSAEPGPAFIGCPQPISENDFKIAVNAKPRILFNVNGANHLDPMYSCVGNTCRELVPGALFLSCHVKGVSSDCDLLYGSTGKKVCSMGSERPYPSAYTLKECNVAGHSYNTTVVV